MRVGEIIPVPGQVALGNGVPLTGHCFNNLPRSRTEIPSRYPARTLHGHSQAGGHLWVMSKIIPYSRKFSREKTFAKMTNRKISWRKLSRTGPDPRKFSPSKVSRYTVIPFHISPKYAPPWRSITAVPSPGTNPLIDKVT